MAENVIETDIIKTTGTTVTSVLRSADGEITEQQVLDALRVVEDPDLHRDIVTLGFVKDIKICDGNVAFKVELTTPACPVAAPDPKRSSRSCRLRRSCQSTTPPHFRK